jgi:hypothetical protein
MEERHREEDELRYPGFSDDERQRERAGLGDHPRRDSELEPPGRQKLEETRKGERGDSEHDQDS